jgi:hypothetical protein
VPKENILGTSKQNEMMHVDLCRMFKHSSLGGSKYFLISIHDHSLKTWIFFLLNKTCTFDKFKSPKNQIKNETSLVIKVLHIDHGMEFLSLTFNTFCQNESI